MRLKVLIFLLPVLCLPALAEQWTIDDILLTERASSFDVSRDGKLVVWAQSQMDKEKGRSVSHLYLRSLAEGYEVQLTRGRDSASSPALSPDGHKVAFLSSRTDSAAKAEGGEDDESDQVWIIDTRGGEPYKLSSFAKEVKEVNWLDNDTLLVTATEDPTLYSQEVEKRKDTSDVVDDEEHAPPVRLFRLTLAGKKAERLTTNADRITDTFVSDDGVWVVTVHERSLSFEYNEAIRPVTVLNNLREGTEQEIFDGTLMPENVQFTADAAGFYFSAPYSTNPKYTMAATPMLYYYDIAGHAAAQVDLDWERGLGNDFAVTPSGVLALLADGVRYKPALYAKSGDGWTRQWVEGDQVNNIFHVEFSRDGKTLLYDYSTASDPGQWYAGQLAGTAIVDAKPITKVNTHMENKLKARTEVVHWTGARDEQVEGILYYPHNFEEGKKYPLVLSIHGGPHSQDLDEWADRFGYPNQLFAQRGAFVLKPNYHGSGNYGLKWGESITDGNYNDLEWVDCERGVDAMIARGFVDADKLGVAGWSNGSIITIELTTRTTRYKVASAGAGDVDWISDWANCQFGHAFDDLYIGTTPLEDPQLYIKKSPLFRMDKVTTPTIIFFGTTDRQVPTEQGWQHFRALQYYKKTDVKFILMPGEAHSPRKYAHQVRKLTEEMAWFDKYLFGTGGDQNESLKPTSPLSAALARKAAGDVPVTVVVGDIHVGRFEVTRAQYAAFDSNYEYPAGTADYPANNISFENAKAYCEWLTGKTGHTYRLATEKELGSKLKASANGNTLDYWAGYTLNPDDAAALEDQLAKLDPGELLKPVGSLAGTGDDPVYDLDGNVAEWVVADDGTGKAMGGSADRPVDDKADVEPAPAYIGFRVVEDL